MLVKMATRAITSELLGRRFTYKVCRTLYSPAALKTESYAKIRSEKRAIANKVDVKFRDRIKYSLSSPKHIIFTSDLTTMTYLIRKNDDDDLKLFMDMLDRVCKHTKNITDTTLGNLIMCMFYYLDKPNLALETVTNPEYQNLFRKSKAIIVLMDLLYEKGKYEEIIEVFKIIPGGRDGLVILSAACYKMNTKQSLEFMKNIFNQIKEEKYEILRKSVLLTSALAIKQDDPQYALELLSSCEEEKFFTVTNLRLMALADIGRVEEVFPVLKAILDYKTPIQSDRNFIKKQLFPDCLKKIQAAVERVDHQIGISHLLTMENKLRYANKICRHTIENELLREIKKKAEDPMLLRTFEEKRSRNMFENYAKQFKIRKGLIQDGDY